MTWEELRNWFIKQAPRLIEKLCQLEIRDCFFIINGMFFGKDNTINYNGQDGLVDLAENVSFEKMKKIIELLWGEVEDEPQS